MRNLLSASDFMNYDYCPRIVYFTHVIKQPQTKRIKQIKGLQKDKSFKKTSSRSKIIKKGNKLSKLYNVVLESKYDIITKVDCIAFDKENNIAFPIQLKYSFQPNRIYRTQKIQLMIEAILIEENFGYSVPFGYIKYIKSNKLTKVYWGNINEIFSLKEKIIDIIKNEKFPESTKYKKRCVDCCYRRMCNG